MGDAEIVYRTMCQAGDALSRIDDEDGTRNVADFFFFSIAKSVYLRRLGHSETCSAMLSGGKRPGRGPRLLSGFVAVSAD